LADFDRVLQLLSVGPELPDDLDFGIGIVGAGHIINWAHLPAYRKVGFSVVGIFDIVKEKAQATAGKFGVPKVYDSLDEMLGDPKVEVVDLALPPTANYNVGKSVIAAKKNLLCQKPLTMDYQEAVELVKLAKAAGVKLAVNQNLRWSPAMWSCRQLIRGGILGQPVAGFIEHRFGGDLNLLGETWPPYYMQPLAHLYAKPKVVYDATSPPPSSSPSPIPRHKIRGNILGDGVHIIDSLRVFFGMPKSVIACVTGTPSNEYADTVNTIALKYGNAFSVTVRLSYNNWWGDSHLHFSFEGMDRIIRGSIGDYSRDFFKEALSPNDTLEIGFKDRPVHWMKPTIRGSWLPDAMVYSMGELLKAIKTGSEPETSGSDNLSTLRIIHAALESADTGNKVNL